jgi:hypothetical protein
MTMSNKIKTMISMRNNISRKNISNNTTKTMDNPRIGRISIMIELMSCRNSLNIPVLRSPNKIRIILRDHTTRQAINPQPSILSSPVASQLVYKEVEKQKHIMIYNNILLIKGTQNSFLFRQFRK